MKITLIKIDSLKPSLYNPRQITGKQYEDLKKSIEKFGMCKPIVININPERLYNVIGGHQRLQILRDLGAEKVPTVSVNLNEEEEKELNIRLNKNGGQWDIDLLSNFDVVDLKEWGFKDIELGFNIDKIEEKKESKIVLTIKEDDISKASNLHKELVDRGFNATIKW